MIVIHLKLLLKVSSEDAAVPKAINILAIWMSLSNSFLVVRFDYSSLCRFLFFVLVIYIVLVIYNQFKKASALEPILKYFMKTWRSKSFIRNMTLASCIIHIFKVVSVSSYDWILFFWHVTVLHIIHLCRDRQLW